MPAIGKLISSLIFSFSAITTPPPIFFNLFAIITASFGLVKVHAIGGNSPITFTDTIIENQNLQVLGS
ncbi:MAG: hypothetical protein ACPGDB_01355, partial [Fusobacterium sp.]